MEAFSLRIPLIPTVKISKRLRFGALVEHGVSPTMNASTSTIETCSAEGEHR
jgi:hypothetical protein